MLFWSVISFSVSLSCCDLGSLSFLLVVWSVIIFLVFLIVSDHCGFGSV